ncbi:metal-dependent hydrolase [Iamia sp. SCSIO 61187]|uniref:metal-dependent hydrolase n=1 Tax=Iamia sp. SCSIO 61187 TaxID=2722752 RepID=UPI001C635D7E|nr:metal-dependent hydrolase [Iamia sp. SCSIO 61187]QYG91925.1 metal-dependent hydrolase [Iamia sp. SCSIO 61187]
MSTAVVDPAVTEDQAEDAAPGAQASSDRSFPVRRISFFDGDLSEVPHFYMDGDIVMSHIVAVLSSLFPEGEDYFVRSVRHYRDQITDPVLKKQVAGFIGQEAIHGREHRTFNDRLDDMGYPTKALDRLTGKRLKFNEKVAPPKVRLAVTAALEHYTATLAEVLLGDERAQAMFSEDEVRHLLMWHAIEESEHKAVAFDVYQACVGDPKLRARVMNVMTVGFIGTAALSALYSIARDPEARRDLGALRRSFAKLKDSPWLTKDVRRRIRDYNRPDFHPDDHDASELLETWRTRLFGEAGALNDHLATKAS